MDQPGRLAGWPMRGHAKLLMSVFFLRICDRRKGYRQAYFAEADSTTEPAYSTLAACVAGTWLVVGGCRQDRLSAGPGGADNSRLAEDWRCSFGIY